MKTPVLFTCSSSVYCSLSTADPWPFDRDARLWLGEGPVIAHPPCRAWARLRAFAKPRDDEKDLARFAVHTVRSFGGVLEHPEASSLWAEFSLPRPGVSQDMFGGWTFGLSQDWFGHPAPKKTWLYIVGAMPRDLPPLPFALGCGASRVELQCSAHRERTPLAFAQWLLDLADIIRAKQALRDTAF